MSDGYFTGPVVRYCNHCSYPLPGPGSAEVHCTGCHMTVRPGETGWVAVEVDASHLLPRRPEKCPTCVIRVARWTADRAGKVA